MRTFVLWVWTIVYFMIIMPIGFIIQGVICTPIEIINLCIKEKRIIDPFEYWTDFYKTMCKKYYEGYLTIEELE